MIWYGWIQSPAVSKRHDVRWCSFRWSLLLSIVYVRNSVFIGLSRILHAHISYETDTAKSSQHSAEFPIVCMIWYGWIQSPAVSIRPDVRWCSFRWSISLSIDYVWCVYTDRAISTPRYSYYICNTYTKIITGNWHDTGNDLSCRTIVKR